MIDIKKRYMTIWMPNLSWQHNATLILKKYDFKCQLKFIYKFIYILYFFIFGENMVSATTNLNWSKQAKNHYCWA